MIAAACLLSGALLAATPAGPAEALPTASGSSHAVRQDDRLQTVRVQAMVERAHLWLVARQNKDGSFSIERSEASHSAPVAVTALAAMSLMAAGHLPDRGRHGVPVRRAVDWLVDRCGEDGYITTDADSVSKMHGQGYAILALTQACGMSGQDPLREERLRAAVQRGVNLIESSQGQQGGWYYEPRATTSHEGSITVCMVQALRAARDAGFAVKRQVIRRAEDYLKASQNPVDGRFRYALNDPKTSWALTAAALATLNALGDYSSARLQQGFDALQRSDPILGEGRFEMFQEYGALYAAQAYWQHADQRAFDRWWPEFLRDSAERQQPEGQFRNGDYGNVYATAIVSLTLQVPVGYLPIFQR